MKPQPNHRQGDEDQQNFRGHAVFFYKTPEVMAMPPTTKNRLTIHTARLIARTLSAIKENDSATNVFGILEDAHPQHDHGLFGKRFVLYIGTH